MANQALAILKSSVNGYLVGQTAVSAVCAGASDTVSTEAITEELGDKKVIVGVKIDTAYDDVVAILAVQGSFDNTTWTTLATAIADTTPNVTGEKQALVDLSGIQAPYYRLLFNSSGLAVNTNGKCQLKYAVKP